MKLPRSVPLALLISAPIFAITFLPGHWSSFPGSTVFAKAMLAYGLVALLSVAAMAAFGEGRWKDFGFQRPRGPWWRLSLHAVALGAVSALAVELGAGRGLDEALKGMAPARIPLLVLVASTIEELAVRGWLQGFLEPLRPRRVKLGAASVSVPVLTGALAFGAWHSPAIAGDAWTGSVIVVFTTLLGGLAGTGRERTASLIPAVVIHVAGNVGAVLGGMAYLVIQRAHGGQGLPGP